MEGTINVARYRETKWDSEKTGVHLYPPLPPNLLGRTFFCLFINSCLFDKCNVYLKGFLIFFANHLVTTNKLTVLIRGLIGFLGYG